MLTRLKAAISAFRTRSALWDGAATVNRLQGWSGTASAPNAYYDNPVILRGRAESEFRNNAFARKAIDALVNAAWGASGMSCQFRDRQAQELWERWTRSVDLSERFDWIAFGQLLTQTVLVSGEAFVLLSLDPDSPGVPLRLHLLGPEYLDTSRVDSRTFAGIEYDGLKPSGYWFFRQSPALTPVGLTSVFVPAENCLHIFRPIAPGAQRGQSALAPVLLALRELAEYLEAALVRQKTSALYCGFVRTPDGSNPLLNESGVPSLEPGAMIRLKPGEEFENTEPPDAGASFDPFVRAQLRRIAAGLGLPYEILSGDLSNVTFASGRAGLLEFRRTIEALQYGLLAPQFCAPVLRRWSQIAAAMGLIEKEPEGARWIGPTVEMLDRRAETLATVSRIRAGLMSRSEAVAQAGWRVEDIDAEIAADNARADQLGLTLDSDPRKTTLQGQEQQGAAI